MGGARIGEVIVHLDGQELSRLVPERLPVNMKLDNGRTLFMLLVHGKANPYLTAI